MIGKLIIVGIAALAIIIAVPALVKESSHVPAIQTIKERIDYATTNHTLAPGSVAYGGILSGVNSTKQTANTTAAVPIQTVSTNAPQNVIEQAYTGQVFQNVNSTCQISVPGMAETINGKTELTHILQVPNCNMTVNKPVQVTLTISKQNSTQTPTNGSNIRAIPYYYSNNDGSANSSPPTPASPEAPQYFQTVQLNAVNQGTNALLSYDDTTGKTTQVTVTLKNSDRILFSGTFYASQFHTEVNDVPNTPHIIEMTIQNAIYGTLHASVYAPPTVQNSTISGIFTN